MEKLASLHGAQGDSVASAIEEVVLAHAVDMSDLGDDVTLVVVSRSSYQLNGFYPKP